MNMVDFESRFERIPESGCWIWTAPITMNGYGKASDKRVTKLAHRLSWKLYRGEIPDGLFVLHKCDVKCCVNPDHLYVGTQSNNMIDRHVRSRDNNANKKKTHCKYGHEFTPENTVYVKNNGKVAIKKDGRICLECKRQRARMTFLKKHGDS